ncbi:MAG: hypothetical protein Tsb0013_14090 [Phycisphaerales bacterium]
MRTPTLTGEAQLLSHRPLLKKDRQTVWGNELVLAFVGGSLHVRLADGAESDLEEAKKLIGKPVTFEARPVVDNRGQLMFVLMSIRPHQVKAA